jgi:OFA family oxalate/formate antiporter-like MFS transporter
LADVLIRNYGLPNAMLMLGGAFLLIVIGLSQLLITPPKGFSPGGANVKVGTPASIKSVDFRPLEMLATPQFYLCWLLYAVGAGAGLMIISQLGAAVAEQANLLKSGFWLVMACGVGNGAGRILAGMASDKLGRRLTLQGCFIIQAGVMIALSFAVPKNPVLAGLPVMLILSALVGANYGANLSLFPSLTKDFYGLKNFGVNYGLVFTAWGFGGFLLSLAASKIYQLLDKNFTYNYYGAAVFLFLAAILAIALKPPRAVGSSDGT